jgi:tetratricopeptide (TPR) repeat protein
MAGERRLDVRGWALALAVLMGGAGSAAAAVPDLPAVVIEQSAIERAGAELQSSGDPDADAVTAAISDIDSAGLLSVKDHVDALHAVLGHMPQPFARAQQVGDRLVYHADSIDDCVRFAAASRDHRAFVCLGNPYPAAAFYLGSYYNEIGQPGRALEVLDLGRIAGPDSPLVASERDAALIALRRWDDALAGANQGLAVADLAPADRARLLRNRGYALTELNRLDEAQKAYEDSLTLEPGNALAQNELKYIAGLKSGVRPATPGQIFRPGATPTPTP